LRCFGGGADNEGKQFTDGVAGSVEVVPFLDEAGALLTYELIAADILNSGEARAATTSMSNITGWSFSVEANKEYIVEIEGYIANGLGGFRFDFTGPASPTAVKIIGVMTWDGAAPITDTDTAFSTALTYAITTGSHFRATLTLRNGANAGTVQFRCAQNTASGTTTVEAGSKFMAWRVG
jgi:hypothetical protein